MSPLSLAKRVRLRTWIIIGGATLLVAAAVTTSLVIFLPTSSAAQEVTTTATASLETIEQSVEVTGTLSPLVTEDVSFPASGTVQTVDVVAGQTVAVGDVLGTIDTLQANADLLQAQADLASAQADLADASTTAAIAAANASVAVAQAAVTDAQAALDGTTLVAPVAGVVTSVAVEAGDVVGSTSSGAGGGDTGSTSTAAFTIVGQDSWQVAATVGEAEMALIAVDDQVELTTDDGTAFFGVVSEVGLLPSTDSGTAAYPVTITVTGTAEGLYDGISVTASIIYERRTDVLTVPSAAVTTATDGTSTVTLVGADGSQVETTVEVGETSGTLIEILSGLAEGDEVVVATFTPGEGNTGTFPGGGTDGTFPGGDGTFPGGGTPPEGGFPQNGQNG